MTVCEPPGLRTTLVGRSLAGPRRRPAWLPPKSAGPPRSRTPSRDKVFPALFRWPRAQPEMLLTPRDAAADLCSKVTMRASDPHCRDSESQAPLVTAGFINIETSSRDSMEALQPG